MPRRREAALFVLLALALRLWDLAGESVWLDEAHSVWLARQPFSDMLQAVWAGDLHPPLFYIGLRGWLQLFPGTPVWLRLPQAFVGAGCVGLAYLLARSLAGLTAARCCALLAATSHYLWLFDRECRMYPWVGLAILAYLLSLSHLSRGGTRWWSAVVLGAAWLGAYCDYRFGLLAVFGGLYFLWNKPRRGWIFLTLAAGALGCLPLVPLLRHQMSPEGAGTRLALCNDPITVNSLAKLAPGLGGAWYLELPPGPLLLLSAMFVAVLALGLHRSRVVLPALTFAGPLGVILVFSLLKGSSYSVHSSYTLAYPFLLWLGISLAHLARGQRFAFLGLWVVLNLSMMAQTHYRLDLHKQNCRELAMHLLSVVQPGDVVIVVPGFQGRGLTYYHRPRRLLELNPVDLLDKSLTEQLRITRRTWWVMAGDKVVDPSGYARAWVHDNLQVVSELEIRNGPFHEITGRGTRVYEAIPKADAPFNIR